MKKTLYGITVTPERAELILSKVYGSQSVIKEAKEQSRMIYITYTIHNGRRIFKKFSIVEKQETV